MIINAFIAVLKSKKILVSVKDKELVVNCKKESLTADIVAQLKARKQELIDYLSKDPLQLARDIKSIYALSPLQQGMLYHSYLNPEGGDYIVQVCCELHGDLDEAAFYRAWEALARRHDVLRTSFVSLDQPQPLQLVQRDIVLPMTYQDWSGLSRQSQNERLEQMLLQQRKRGFKFNIAPLMNIDLILLGPGHYQFVWGHHHALSDGWSLPLVMQELQQHYRAQLGGQDAQLAPALPYENYIRYLQDRDVEQAKQYWRDYLKGFTTRSVLPQRGTQSGEAQYQLASRQLSADLSSRLQQLARQNQLTLNVVMQTVFAVLLGRYCGESDVVFGTVVSGRPPDLPGVEHMVGPFINTVPVRVELSAAVSCVELLERLQQRQNQRNAFEHSPLREIQSCCDLGGEDGIFENLFIFENFPLDDSQAKSPDGRDFNYSNAAIKEQVHYPLMLMVIPGEQLTLNCQFDNSVYQAAVIEQLLLHFECLAGAMTDNPQRSPLHLPLLSQAEQAQLDSFNPTDHNYPEAEAVHRLIERQARKTPDNIALIDGDQRIDYQTFNARAHRLAHFLLETGVKPGDRVGICLPREAQLMVAVFAVLKAGAAYVPLDPAYPQERLSYTQVDSGTLCVLTASNIELDQVEGVHHIHLDKLDLTHFCSETALPPVDPRSLMYVIYTSGSTGQPKGVMITHNNVFDLLQWCLAHYSLDELHAVLFSTSICFDISVFEMYVPLCVGGQIVIAENALALNSLPAKNEITLINTVPSALAGLVEVGKLPYNIRVANLAGEALGRTAVDKAYANSRLEKLINLYGPSEDTVYSTWYSVGRDETNTPSIGQSLANSQSYVLDDEGQQVALGTIGELYLAGPQLSLGYCNRGGMTAERFLPNPFASQPGERIYRTGDLVKRESDGTLSFVGRIDAQVKVRGFRIELGEIEAAIAQLDGVRKSVVTANEDGQGVKRLVAYVVGEPNMTATWQEALRDRLPAHMVPAIWQMLPQLPLTENGKVDRKALPEPDMSQMLQDYEPPVGPVESLLADICQDLLNLERVGRFDNFFALGGDSIIGIQLVARAKAQGLRLNAKQIFEAKTLAALALEAKTGELLPAEQGEVSGELKLGPIQHWFFEQVSTQRHHFNQSVLLTTPAGLDFVLLGEAFKQLLQHHDVLRARYSETGQGWQQQIVPMAQFDCSNLLHKQHIEAGDSNARQQQLSQHAAQLQGALNLSGSVISGCWYDHGPGQAGRLLLVVHHLAVDGVSWRILLEDLQQAYRQLSQGQSCSLAQKSHDFGRWTAQLANWAGSDAIASHRTYYQQLAGQPFTALPQDFDAPVALNTEQSLRQVSFSLDRQATEQLLRAVPEAFRTEINDVLLTAVLLAFNRFAQIEQLWLNIEGHGREALFDELDVSRTVGWFTAIYPVCLCLAATDHGTALKAVKEQLRAIPQRGVGFGVLRYLGNDQDKQTLAQMPQPGLSFNYLGQFDQAMGQDSLFALCDEPRGDEHAASQQRAHLIDINALVLNQGLQVNLQYSENLHKKSSMQSLLEHLRSALNELIEFTLVTGNSGLTPSDLPAVQLSQAELDQVLQRQMASKVNIKSARDIKTLYPLSPLQQGMLYHSGLNLESGDYVVQISCELLGDLHEEAFYQAWKAVVDRHDVFRTSFIDLDKQLPLQVVQRDVVLPLRLEDWRELGAQQQQSKLNQLLVAERTRPFDFNVAPLMRLNLLALSQGCYQFIWTHHHALSDGWSLPIVMQEVLQVYRALADGRSLQLPPVQPYENYITYLSTLDSSKAATFWQEYLAGFDSPTPLPFNPVDSKEQGSHQGAEKQLLLSHDFTAHLQQTVRDLKVTLNVLIQGVWGVLLSRYSNESDVVFGTVVSGRPSQLAGVEQMVGNFINTIPVRVKLNAIDSFEQLLATLQQQQIERNAYEHSPLQEIQHHSELGGDASLFETLLVFENYPLDDAVVEKAHDSANHAFHVSRASTHEQVHYPLALVVLPGEQLTLCLKYDKAVYGSGTVSRILDHFETLLDSLSDNPNQSPYSAQMLKNKELQRLAGFNQTAREYDVGACVHTTVEQQVKNNPSATAVVDDDSELSYQALNLQANRLAHRLNQLGAKPGNAVAVHLPRGCDLVVAVLAVLKAGCCYVPLDVDYPKERLSHIINDSAPDVIISSSAQALPTVERQVVDPHSLDDELAITDPDHDLDAGVPAYILYTSGTTGVPKGVQVSHRALQNLINWHREHYQIDGQHKASQLASFGFDACVWEIWPYLCSGAALHVASRETVMDPQQLAGWLAEHRISHCFMPTPLAEEVMLSDVELDSLKVLLTGGDRLRRMKPQGAGYSLVNHYGPTESAVVVTATEVASGSGAVPPIGRPIDNLQVYILDDYLRPVAEGVIGQMYVGGASLAEGYWRRPRLTAESFIPNPHSDKVGARMYRTGDLARYGKDGNIEFIGRTDHQVKIRGFRIELAEIESAMLKLDGVADGVVVVVEDDTGVKRLAAYVTAQSDDIDLTTKVEAFKTRLKQQLPAYMVPGVWVVMDKLPITANGKVDKKALPEPDLAHLGGDYEAPQNDIEQALAEIWQGLLGLERVSRHDSFFDIGGDSIVSIQMISRAREAGLHLSARQIFEAQTIAELAALDLQQTKVTASQSPVSGEVPLTAMQRWFFANVEIDNHHFNQSALLRTPVNVDTASLQQALGHLINHHDALRACFDRDEQGQWRQTFQAEATVALVIAAIDGESDKAQQRLKAMQHQQVSFDLATGPLFKALYMHDGEDNGYLLLLAHHLIIDVVSWRIVIEDLIDIYARICEQKPAIVKAKTSSCLEWSERLLSYADSEQIKQQVPYWKGLTEQPFAPVPRTKAEVNLANNTIGSLRYCTIRMDRADTSELLRTVHAAYHTEINDILLAALWLAYREFSEQGQLWLNLEGHGREEIFDDIDISRTVGWFTSVFPVNLSVDADSGLERVIKSIKEQLRQIPDRGFGYPLLRYLADDSVAADLAAMPKPQISFNYLGQVDEKVLTNNAFNIVDEDKGNEYSPRQGRDHVLDFLAIVKDGRLQVMCGHSDKLHDMADIEALMAAYRDALGAIIRHCLDTANGGLTPSDVAGSGLNQQTLEKVEAMFSQARMVESVYPLSSLQQGLYYQSLLEVNSSEYTVQVGCRLQGNINGEVMHQAWQAVLERHDILRTQYVKLDDGTMLQVVHRHCEFPWQQKDFRHLSDEQKQRELDSLLYQDKLTGFDFEQVPLMRFMLLQLEDNEYHFVWSYHHILMDGWSLPIVMGDFIESYQALNQGQSAYRPAVKPYHQFICWVLQQDQQEAKNYWRKALAGFVAPTPLLNTKPGQKEHKMLTKEHRLELPPSLTAEVVGFTQANRVTLNIFVQALWSILLSRYSRENDVVFGSVVSGRPVDLDGVEHMVGPFFNTIPVRVDMEMVDSFADLLEQLQSTQLHSSRFEYLPLSEVQKLSDITGGESLFESLLVFQNYPLEDVIDESEELDEHLEHQFKVLSAQLYEQTHFPIELLVVPGERLYLEIKYDAERFSNASVEGLMHHLVNLMQYACEDVSRHPLAIPMVDPQEAQRMLKRNYRKPDYPQHLCLHQLFERQVEKTPDAIAAIYGDESITYEELNRRANQVAHALLENEVELETKVALCVERSIGMLVGQFGVMKSGATYVPIDPSFPEERIEFVLENSEAEIVLTQRELFAELPISDMTILLLDSDLHDTMFGEYDEDNIPVEDVGLTSENLIYIIHTSGSTGQPKGTEVPHRGMVRLIENTSYAKMGPDEVVLQHAPIAFDACCFEIFGALMHGAKLVLLSGEGYDLDAVAEDVARHDVTTVWSTTGLLHSIADERPATLNGVTQVLTGGDILSPVQLNKLLDYHPQLNIISCYGLTEDSTFSTTCTINSALDEKALVPIGDAINGTSVYILDDWLQPVPVGIPGEIYVAGGGLARGYLNQLGLTAERFVPNPYADKPGERMYKTGDLARYREDGHLEFWGRIDSQVKIRGFRVELGEIEMALMAIAGVATAVTMVRTSDNHKHIAAYITEEQPGVLNVQEMMAMLKEQLPQFMVPSSITLLDVLPLTANGKLDRRALPEPEMDFSGSYVAPRNELEQKLADIWQAVLGLARVGIEDNYFELGGDSILSIQVLSQAKNEGLDFKVADLFKYQTIAALMDNVPQTGLSDDSGDDLAQLEAFDLVDEIDRVILPDQLQDAYPLAATQSGMIFHSELSSGGRVYHDIISYHFAAELDVDVFEQAFAMVVSRHDILRTGFIRGNKSPYLQCVRKQIELPLQVVDIRELDEQQTLMTLKQWREQELANPFGYQGDVLWRGALHLRADNEFQLSMSFHHAILDGWSMASLITELLTNYYALANGDSVCSEPLPVCYRDYVALELAAIDNQDSQAFWREQLSSSEMIKLPPLAGSNESDDSAVGQSIVELEAYAVGLNQLAKDLQVPLKTVLLAAHLKVMSLLQGRDDVLTGLVTNGRIEADGGEKVLGLFLNSLPLRFALPKGDWQRLISEVFKSEQQIVAHRRYPLLHIQQMANNRELFDVIFNYTHFHVYQGLSDIAQDNQIAFKGIEGEEQTNFPLVVNFSRSVVDENIIMRLDYNKQFVSDEQARQIGGYYRKVFAAIVEQPNQDHHQQILLSEAQNAALSDYNQTAADYSKDTSIAALFAQRVAQSGSQTAIIDGERTISFAELGEQVEVIALQLLEQRVQVNDIVGIHLTRSPLALVSILAVLKVGAIYVALDPSYPAERNQWIAADAGIAVMLSEEQSKQTLEGKFECCYPAVWLAQQTALDGQPENIAVGPLQGANLIYTSGSTGRPKGVLNSHRALLNRMSWMWQSYPFAEDEVMAQKTALSFVDSVWELFGGLLQGIATVFIDDDTVKEPDGFINALQKYKVSRLVVVPSLLRNLMELSGELGQQLSAMRYLTCSGESLPVELVARFYREFDDCTLLNLYGSSEVTADATAIVVPPDMAVNNIGRPISNMQAYVLNEQLQMLPDGVVGELYLCGDSVALGYLGQGGLTADSFLPNPYGDSSRLYRTGDMVRRLPGGDLEYLGRIDHQVNVRGFRVELGEIESAIARIDGIGNQAVAVHQSDSGQQHLVAYVVAGEPDTVDADQIDRWRLALGQLLPQHMLPDFWQPLTQLPLLPNGKVDRKALAPLDVGRQLEHQFVAPENEAQKRMAALWGQVLSSDKVGIHDNFFHLGGHSLLAAQLVARVRASFDCDLPLRALFEAPTIEKLLLMIQGQGQTAGRYPQLTAVSREEPVVLSYGQQRLWFLEQFDSTGSAYNMPFAMRLNGALDSDALEQSFATIVNRHEVLRTSLLGDPGRDGEGRCSAQVLEQHEFTIERMDLSELTADAQEARLAEVALNEAGQRFDLAAPPLLRVCLLRLASQQHVLLVTMHHIVTDGWSSGVLIKELVACYRALSNNEQPQLAPLSIQYRDYAHWQHQLLQGVGCQSQLQYWSQSLEDLPPLLEMPTDRPRPVQQSYRGAAVDVRLSKALSEQLARFSQDAGVTLFMTLMSGYAVLLSRYSGQQDIAVGTPVANRVLPELESLIGFFVNTLVIRNRIDRDASFTEMLAQVKQHTLDAFEHQDIPFEKLVDHLKVERSLSHSPLFQVMFVLQNAPLDALTLGDLVIEPMRSNNPSAKFDLTLNLIELDSGIAGELEYNCDLFEVQTAERMVQDFVALLEQLVLAPQAPVGSHSLHSALQSDSFTEAQVPPLGLHQLFEQQVAERPEQAALIAGNEQLSYEQANQRANQLARYLQSRGVKAGDIVAVCLSRRIEMPLAVLAVLKCGAAYLPLDPANPKDRLDYMQSNAGVRLLLTESKLAQQLAFSGDNCVCIDQIDDLASLDGSNLDAVASTPDDTAFLIYTSGSTGMPKGSMISSRSVLNLIDQFDKLAPLSAGDHCSLWTSFGFDVSVYEMFSPFYRGGTLHVIDEQLRLDIDGLFGYLAEHDIRGFYLPASYLGDYGAYLAANPSAKVSCGRLLVGVEAIPLATLQAIIEQSPGLVIINGYGPSETTICTTLLNVNEYLQSDGPLRVTTPIGREIQNCRLLVLDEYLHPVPVGVRGELYIGGTGVSKGYINQPELTDKAFIDYQGERFYGSGDMVRRLTDGTIEFVGRRDSQVKIRGFRIELGEVQNAVARLDGVRESVVIVHRDDKGVQRLVAYVVAEAASEGSAKIAAEQNRLERWQLAIKRYLPDYMVPPLWLPLDKLPLSPNGKVDSKALPEPDLTELQSAFELPQGEVEQGLAEIWQNLLGIENVGRMDNFFKLGGDSIISIQVIARAKRLGLQLNPRQMFEARTLAELAAMAEPLEQTTAEQQMLSGEMLMGPVQHWFFEHIDSQRDHFNQAALLQTPVDVDVELLRQSLCILAGHHDILRATYTLGDNGWTQTLSALDEKWQQGLLQQVDLSETTESQLPQQITAECDKFQRSLALAQRIFQAVWLDCGKQRPGRLLLAIHHLGVDGVSWRILLEDLESIYTQLSRKEQPILAAKTHDYGSWAAQMAAFAQSEQLEQEKAWWLALSERPFNPMKTDNDGLNDNGSSETYEFKLDEKLTQTLLREVSKAYRTDINDILLCALLMAYRDFNGEGPLWLSLEGHGREALLEDIDISRTVGWFTAMYPVCLDLASDDLGDNIKAIKQQLREIPGKGVGFLALSQLADEQTRSQLKAIPQPQLSFNYLGQFDQVVADGAVFTPALEDKGAMTAAAQQRIHLLDISGAVTQSCLYVGCNYNRNIHDRTSIEALMSRYQQHLEALIKYTQVGRHCGLTPSDVPGGELDQNQLDGLLDSHITNGCRIDNARDIESVYPLSPLQQGVLFHSLSEPHAGAYVVQLDCELSGNLDETAFASAWQQVVLHHGVFRTSFIVEDQVARLQLVQHNAKMPWQVLDWSSQDKAAQLHQWQTLLDDDRAQGFDLAVAPLMRCYLVRLGNGRYRFLWSHHHALADGWSLPIVLNDVGAIYDAVAQNKQPQLAPPKPYIEYMQYLLSLPQEQAQAYWRDYLKGFTTPTRLTLPAPRTEAVTVPQCRELLSRQLSDSLHRLARDNQLTLNIVMQGLWGMLLSIYSGEQDVVFGSVVSGRPAGLAGVEQMVGPFINTLPVRMQVDAQSALATLLKRLQQQQVERSSYEYLPLLQVQQLSEVGSGQDLFHSLFVFENYPIETQADRQGELPPHAFSMDSAGTVEQVHYPLMMMVMPGQRITLSLKYLPDHYDHGAMERLLQHYRHLMEVLLQDINTPRSLLALPDSAQLQRLSAYNRTAVEHRLPGSSVHGCFEAQVNANPDAVAVYWQDQTMRYGELNRHANRLANYLIRLGCRPGDNVGLYLDRSPLLLVGALAIIKTGAAYVPLDPSYPQQRLCWMAQAAAADILLSEGSLGDLPYDHEHRCVLVDNIPDTAQDNGNPGVAVHPSQPLYTMYTSGSTGKPKGVVGSHKAALNRIGWMHGRYPFEANEVMSHKTVINFIDSVWELFGGLLKGVPTAYIGNDEVVDVVRFIEQLRHLRVSRLVVVPSLLSSMLQVLRGDNQSLPDLKVLTCSGEALAPALLERCRQQLPGCVINNLYGSTEVAGDATWCEVSSYQTDVEGICPIGKPIDNTRCYVLDDNLQPLPPGVVGKLYVGGDNLALGYAGQSGLTAQTFIPNPFADEPGDRLYDTGDQVRWLEDGELEYIGRVDFQVKVRGVRIELGDVENAIAGLPGVSAAVVAAVTGNQGDVQLVAYVVAAGQTVDDMSEQIKTWRGALAAILPSAMQPAIWQPLEVLPLLDNGKVNRSALPQVDIAQLAQGQYVAPQSEYEKQLAQLWEDVLGVEQVGVNDNFFELGGHSLLATRVVVKLRDNSGIDLPIQTLFENQTLAELACRVEEIAELSDFSEPDDDLDFKLTI